MSDDFLNNEVQESLGEIGVQVGLFRQVFEPCDLLRLARWIGRGKVVLGLEAAHCLGMFEPLAQRVDKDCIQPVDAGAVALQQLGRAGYSVFSQRRILSV